MSIPMNKRIVIFCTNYELGGAGRHKWRWQIVETLKMHSGIEVDVWDRKCVRCGYWYMDVLG